MQRRSPEVGVISCIRSSVKSGELLCSVVHCYQIFAVVYYGRLNFTWWVRLYCSGYERLSVVEEDRSCVVSVTDGRRQHIRSSSENSDSSRRQRVRCGSRSHPWLLEAQTGQQVNVSLLDFSSGHGQRTQLDARGPVSDDCGPARVQYGYIVDKTNKNNVSVCLTDAQQRHKHLYQSTGNVVEIVLTRDDSAAIHHNYLISFVG